MTNLEKLDSPETSASANSLDSIDPTLLAPHQHFMSEDELSEREDDPEYKKFRIRHRKITVFESPRYKSRAVGFLKRGAMVQGKVEGTWTRLRGSGFILTQYVQPKPVKKSKYISKKPRKKGTVR
jgi:hypothetical protein